MTHKLLTIVAALMLAACAREPQPDVNEPASAARDQVNSIANAFVDAYYRQYPEEVYEVGYPDAPQDRFGDHSKNATAHWDEQLDSWLVALDGIDVPALAGTPEALTYVFTRERLQSIIAMRSCKMTLWNVSPTWTGWQSQAIATLAVQPVATADEKQNALARARDIERFVQTEIANLKTGMDTGYLAPTSNVTAVVDQMDTLIHTPIEESPFFDPAQRSDDAEFKTAYRQVVAHEVHDALLAYRDFLQDDYRGRGQIGVGANPNGADCYAASVRFWSSLPADPMQIHRTGLSEMSRIQTEMLQIAQESFGTSDLKSLFEELRSNPEYTFASEQAMLDYVNAAVLRGQQAVAGWFGHVPDAELRVIASPAYQKDSGGGFYSAGAADGSRPGIYQVGTYNPQGISKAGTESTAFHESWPGHHLQMSVALLNESLAPVLRYMYVAGMGEGWGLYSERLADEMGLYSSDLARLGMLSNEAYRAARLVVDPGMHVLGWTRQQAIDYMLEHTAEGLDAISGEVDRYAAVPGQATSYLVGSLEIQRLRKHAAAALGDTFDIREFHDRVLAHGGVTLPMLGASINAWIEEASGQSR
ncbi:MAG TPA: DUF885 domain-containing protein [Woeseiaceae bacterium]|nr:DUF885 domain-containing protein [Woeseiaceae bacterium]